MYPLSNQIRLLEQNPKAVDLFAAFTTYPRVIFKLIKFNGRFKTLHQTKRTTEAGIKLFQGPEIAKFQKAIPIY